MIRLHIDIETYSDVDLKNSGVYKYVQSQNFEILMIAFAFGSKPVKIIDLKGGEKIPTYFISALNNPLITKIAHNAVFERLCFKASGFDIPVDQWECTQVKAAYCGLPLALDQVSKVLNDHDKIKDSAGKALIRYFSIPCKPTKRNEGRSRNLPHHDPHKWQSFKDYCVQDVEAEREVHHKLDRYELPDIERTYYNLDQKINDLGVAIDLQLTKKATLLNSEYQSICINRLKEITGLDNPNSVEQLKKWLSVQLSQTVKSLTKDDVTSLLKTTENKTVREVLSLRQKISKSSIKKYVAILNCVVAGRGHGFFQFYGANRTGRWAGRLVQLHNLVRNSLKKISEVRRAIKLYDLDTINLIHGDLSHLLSQLVRTNFVASEGNLFAVADFSAIEARITAWLAAEQWRLDVFETHGKIYEASASSMFNIPVANISKGSDLRQKGKIAELALGYQGGVGALIQMGAEEMGLSNDEMKDIIKRWRKASPNIVKLWKDLENCAKKAIKTRGTYFTIHNAKIGFMCDADFLQMVLPSGRRLFYYQPQLKTKTVRKADGGSFTAQAITYMGLNDKKKWWRIDTYGGKLLENASQAIARDLLANSMLTIDSDGFDVVMHVHDETISDVPENDAEAKLDRMCRLMEISPDWAKGLTLAVDGYLTPFYLKD